MCIHRIDIEKVSNYVFLYVFHFNYHFFSQTKQTTATHMYIHTFVRTNVYAYVNGSTHTHKNRYIISMYANIFTIFRHIKGNQFYHRVNKSLTVVYNILITIESPSVF